MYDGPAMLPEDNTPPMTSERKTDLVIVGAGPAGLACAIAARRAGLDHLVLDKGTIADAIRRFPANMTFFSTADLLEIGDVPFLSSGFRPTRSEAMRYYLRTAQATQLTFRTGEEVRSIRPAGSGFRVETSQASYGSRFVVVATGYYDTPNPYPVPGADLPDVHRRYTEPFLSFGKRVAIVGGRNSAVEMALELFRFGAQVTMIHRGRAFSEGVKYWLLPDIENRIKAGEIRALFGTEVAAVRPGRLLLKGEHAGEIDADEVYVMIGYQPDPRLLRDAGVRIDPATLIPDHDAGTLETNVPGLYVAGSIAAGKFNNRIFIENGRLHGAAIVAAILKK